MKVEEAETHRRWEEFAEEGRRGANDEWKRRRGEKTKNIKYYWICWIVHELHCWVEQRNGNWMGRDKCTKVEKRKMIVGL